MISRNYRNSIRSSATPLLQCTPHGVRISSRLFQTSRPQKGERHVEWPFRHFAEAGLPIVLRCHPNFTSQCTHLNVLPALPPAQRFAAYTAGLPEDEILAYHTCKRILNCLKRQAADAPWRAILIERSLPGECLSTS